MQSNPLKPNSQPSRRGLLTSLSVAAAAPFVKAPAAAAASSRINDENVTSVSEHMRRFYEAARF